MRLPPNPLTDRLAWGFALLAVVVSSMGASCAPRMRSPFGVAAPAAPSVLAAGATAQEVAAAINANTGRIQTYQAPSATVSSPESIGLPLVSASLAAERPRRLRLRATTALTGPEIDLGSNDQRFWVWARRNEPPATYTATHDAWRASPARGQLPLDPARVMDALGMATIDGAAQLSGPVPRDDGSLELTVVTPAPTGAERRVLIVDGATAAVREQHQYDANGSLVASVYSDRFRYDASQGVTLPERVRVLAPGSSLDLTINTGPITINAPLADGGQLWTMPAYDGYPIVDLAGAGASLAGASRAFDLANASQVYGRSESIPTRFADAGPSGNPAANLAGSTEPTAPISAPPISTEPIRIEPASTNATRQESVSVSTTNGFVGLPRGGRPITLPR